MLFPKSVRARVFTFSFDEGFEDLLPWEPKVSSVVEADLDAEMVCPIWWELCCVQDQILSIVLSSSTVLTGWSKSSDIYDSQIVMAMTAITLIDS